MQNLLLALIKVCFSAFAPFPFLPLSLFRPPNDASMRRLNGLVTNNVFRPIAGLDPVDFVL